MLCPKLPITFLIVVTVSFAAWVERINVIVLDREGRPLPGAHVTAIWQLDRCGEHTTLTYTTNASGVAAFYMSNTVPEDVPCIERHYTLRANYFTAVGETVGFVGAAQNYTLRLDVIGVIARIFDGHGRPLVGAHVEAVGIANTTTSGQGIAWLRIPAGRDVQLRACYGTICEDRIVRGIRDTAVNMTLPIWDVKITLLDEWGKRVAAQIIYDNVSKRATNETDAILELFPRRTANITVVIGEVVKIVELIAEPEVVIYVDLSPPTIRSVRIVEVDEAVKIVAEVLEEGPFAAGLAAYPILRWRVNESWTEQKMYPIAKEYDTIVHIGKDFEFQIIATDKQNNIAIYEGKYEFARAEEVPVSVPPRIEIAHIVAIVIIVFIVIVVYRKLRGY